MVHYKPPWVLVELHYANYIVILCFIVVLTAIILYMRRLRPWKSEIKRVPTMSYFMTEEGQAEDGLRKEGVGVDGYEYSNKYYNGQYS
jgi:hypothetical protein